MDHRNLSWKSTKNERDKLLIPVDIFEKIAPWSNFDSRFDRDSDRWLDQKNFLCDQLHQQLLYGSKGDEQGSESCTMIIRLTGELL